MFFLVLHENNLTIKGGHPQFKSAILRTTKLIAELRTEKSCGIAIADLQNLTSAIPLLYSPISSAQDGFKNQPKIFLELSVSLENKNLP
jgi:hypothetical protein